MLLFILVISTKTCVNDIRIHVVTIVHTCKSISSHVINNFIINTLISYIYHDFSNRFRNF